MPLTTWIALFRGINVGGNRILPMNELKALLEDIGCKHVETYIQSGNVVLEHSRADANLLARLISKAVQDSHGFEPKVLLITIEELEKIVRSNPFPDAEDDPKSLHVNFLATEPASAAVDAMNDIKAASESFSLIGNAFFLHAPDGIGRSRLAAKAEKLLGVSATGRNWRTVMKVLAMARPGQ
jgi:uncharacterized protein (DUF1697 family)